MSVNFKMIQLQRFNTKLEVFAFSRPYIFKLDFRFFKHIGLIFNIKCLHYFMFITMKTKNKK